MAMPRASRAGRTAWFVALTSLASVAGLVVAPSAGAVCAPPVGVGSALRVTCPPVGREQTFVVPAGVTTLRVAAVGASGGAGAGGFGQGGGGGPGAIVSANLSVRPGGRLFVLVGGIGRTQDVGEAGAGGFNGGGSGGAQPANTRGGFAIGTGGGGGGASDVRICSVAATSCDTLASRLLVAAGGGGGGGGTQNDFSTGGGGGAGGTTGDGGNGGVSNFSQPAGTGGAGASRTAGGAGAVGAEPGAFGVGGRGADEHTAISGAGGGGGGGLFGGGGGSVGGDNGIAGAGGGGGSSFGPAGAGFAAASSPQGSVSITYQRPAGAPDVRPAVVITRPRAGARLRRRQSVISGRAFDASGVRAVALRIERLPRARGADREHRCTWLVAKRLRRGSCDRPPLLRATLRAHTAWTYRLPAGLPAGRYRVTTYGSDETGLYGNSAPLRERSLTFRLSER